MTKSNKSLNKLSPDAQDWLTLALDPYHDYTRAIEGCPDELTQRSFVRCHNQALTVGCTAENDSIGITYFGAHGAAQNLHLGSPITPANAFGVYPLQVDRCATGDFPTIMGRTTGDTTTLGGFDTTLDPKIPSRIIALGLEVHDITQELYKKGSLTAATMFSTAQKAYSVMSLNGDTTGVSDVGVPFTLLPMVPSSLEALQSAPGSVNWPAHKGIYIVAKMHHPQHPARFKTIGNFNLPRPNIISEGTNGANSDFYTTPTVYILPRHYAAVGGWEESGFESFKIVLSSLSINSAFRITFRTIVEYFPDPDDLTSLSLATLSPAYEPRAFQLYQQVAHRLAVAVPVSSNAAGDWWKAVWKVVQQVAPAVFDTAPLFLTAAGFPEAALAATAAKRAAIAVVQGVKGVQRMRAKRASKKK